MSSRRPRRTRPGPSGTSTSTRASAVAVLGSSLPRPGDPAYETPRALGRELARRGATVVCGGYGGTMEAVCRGACEEGGETVGVVLEGSGSPNAWVMRAVPAGGLSERLTLLRDLSGSAIFLPHGLGTLLEIVWFAESIVKGDVSPRPLVFLGDFWRRAVEMSVDEAATEDGRLRLKGSVRFVETADEAARIAVTGDR